MVDLAYSDDIIEKLLDARTAPSNHAAPAAPAASANAGHANAIASTVFLLLLDINQIKRRSATDRKDKRRNRVRQQHRTLLFGIEIILI